MLKLKQLWLKDPNLIKIFKDIINLVSEVNAYFPFDVS
jgi:hypothetical protein